MLHLNDLTIRLAGRTLIDRATVAIPEGARVGLVGRNGTGKTTLFGAVAGDFAADGGSIGLPRHARIGRVAQEAPSGPQSLLDTVLAADLERAALLAEAETAHDPHRIAEIQTRLADIDAHSAPARAARILAGLGFDTDAQARPCSDFSGGWRMRVALAAVLFSEPDLLLLDEPTNHLDLEGTLWLQDYLARYPRTAVVISHDRDLLDASVDHILHLKDARLTLYRGNYTIFDRQRREKLLLDQKHRKKQDEERKHLEAFVARFKAKASKARQAQSRMKRLEKMETITVDSDGEVKPFVIPAPDRPLPPPLIAIERAAVGYGDHIVLDRLNLVLAPDDRIALLGANGNGKSTLSRLLAGELKPLKGEMRRSDKIVVGYFAQHTLEGIDPTQTPCEHFRERRPLLGEAQVRGLAARAGFSGERADVVARNLSGGEKARLAFALAVLDPPHLLILDEPTNHLDIDSRQALIAALNDFPGAVILVSHDRHLLEASADQLWLVAGGSAAPYDGDLDDYRRGLMGAGDKGAPRDGGARKEARRPATDKRGELGSLRAKIKDAEARMARREAEIARIDAVLARPATFKDDPVKGVVLARERTAAAAALAKAEEDWLAASAELEEAAAVS